MEPIKAVKVEEKPKEVKPVKKDAPKKVAEPPKVELRATRSRDSQKSVEAKPVATKAPEVQKSKGLDLTVIGKAVEKPKTPVAPKVAEPVAAPMKRREAKAAVKQVIAEQKVVKKIVAAKTAPAKTLVVAKKIEVVEPRASRSNTRRSESKSPVKAAAKPEPRKAAAKKSVSPKKTRSVSKSPVKAAAKPAKAEKKPVEKKTKAIAKKSARPAARKPSERKAKDVKKPVAPKKAKAAPKKSAPAKKAAKPVVGSKRLAAKTGASAAAGKRQRK